MKYWYFFLLLVCLRGFPLVGQNNTSSDIGLEAFLEEAIFEGLQVEAFPAAIVAEMLQNPELFFVPECPICEPVQAGMRRYLAEGLAAEGAEAQEAYQRWKRQNGAVQCKELEHLVRTCVALRFRSGDWDETTQRRLMSEMSVGKKKGMTKKHLSNIPARSCPSCEGATAW
ncbi:hypothetical protein [Eisenibacter elegans]|jgi:hypothetical protein|uniref:hypothetical protein n=1 Tax=Eisenibacter elegans TaxID=997 RepID=UPI0003F7F9AA|nr:hypothetical protein [Eisenibacter elegans]